MSACGAARCACLALLAAAVGLLWPAAAPVAVKLNLVGDIMLARDVARRLRDAGDTGLPFRGMAGVLEPADVNFGNLEAPFADGDGFATTHPLIFRAPARNAEGLRRYGFNVLSLANNHALDQGEEGLAFTRRRLAANGIRTVGAGDAWQPAVVDVRGTRIGFIAASYTTYNYDREDGSTVVARTRDLARLTAVIRDLKKRTDFIVVAMHAGVEYTNVPNGEQRRFARGAIDAGARIVAGSHPHWVQPVEIYKRGLIFYSLGNFIFDLDSSEEVREGLCVQLRILRGRLLSAVLAPVKIENRCCARPAAGAEAARILAMAGISRPEIPVPE